MPQTCRLSQVQQQGTTLKQGRVLRSSKCDDARQLSWSGFCELDLSSEVQLTGELDELAYAELRYPAIQEIAYVRLMDAQKSAQTHRVSC